MDDWNHAPAPAQASEWAQDTDRNTFEEAGSLAPGHANPSGIDYETQLSGG